MRAIIETWEIGGETNARRFMDTCVDAGIRTGFPVTNPRPLSRKERLDVGMFWTVQVIVVPDTLESRAVQDFADRFGGVLIS